MNLFKTIKNWFAKAKPSKEVKDWFLVRWDDAAVYLEVKPPGGQAWDDQFYWRDIERICFQATDFMYPDELYVFTTTRPESYLIPMEATGAGQLWGLLIDKGLFDAELAIQAAGAVEGVFCWPLPESQDSD